MNCKAQLVELGEQMAALRARGLGVAGLSYDSTAALKHFATRRRIPFPLLSDPQSEVIRRLGAVNPQTDGAAFGGTILVDERGIVRSKFFEEELRERTSLGTVLLLEGAPPPGTTVVRTDHFVLRTSVSNVRVYPQQRITLVALMQLGPGLHAYAPGAGSYRALDLKVDPHPLMARVYDTQRPPSRPYHFKPLDETMPIYEGRVRLTRDLTLTWGQEMYDFTKEGPQPVTLTGSLEYQVCSATVCFRPGRLPLRWTIEVQPFDQERLPEALRRKPR